MSNSEIVSIKINQIKLYIIMLLTKFHKLHQWRTSHRQLGTLACARQTYLQWRNRALLSILGFLEWSIYQVRLQKWLISGDQPFHLHCFLHSLSYWTLNQSKGGMVNPGRRIVYKLLDMTENLLTNSHTFFFFYKYHTISHRVVTSWITS